MNIYQQTKQLIDEARHVLICLPKSSRVDNTTAALTLKFILEAANKYIEVIGDDFLASPNLKFLTGIDTIRPSLPSLKQLIIKVSTKKTPLKEFSYHTETDQLNIFLEPEQGIFNSKDVSVEAAEYRFDLIITIGVANFQSLGNVFKQAPDFFYTQPIINIDYRANNERFGQVNLINTKNVATSEIVHDLISSLDQEELIDKQLATLLLTGMISETSGLKSNNLTPQVLEKISKLISYQVNVAEINKQLFHTKSLNMLKLWGRVLARLKEAPNLKLVWSLLPQEDFIKSGASHNDLPQVIEELISSYARAHLIMLLWENPDHTIRGLLRTTQHYNALELVDSFSPHGSSHLTHFNVPTSSLIEAEQLLIHHLQNKLTNNHK